MSCVYVRIFNPTYAIYSDYLILFITPMTDKKRERILSYPLLVYGDFPKTLYNISNCKYGEMCDCELPNWYKLEVYVKKIKGAKPLVRVIISWDKDWKFFSDFKGFVSNKNIIKKTSRLIRNLLIVNTQPPWQH